MNAQIAQVQVQHKTVTLRSSVHVHKCTLPQCTCYMVTHAFFTSKAVCEQGSLFMPANLQAALVLKVI